MRLRPDRIIVGADDEKARGFFERLYRPFMMREYKVILLKIFLKKISFLIRERYLMKSNLWDKDYFPTFVYTSKIKAL